MPKNLHGHQGRSFKLREWNLRINVLFCFVFPCMHLLPGLPHCHILFYSIRRQHCRQLEAADGYPLLPANKPNSDTFKHSHRERERAGLFLLPSKLTFKHSFFAKRPLIKRPNHSFAYLCTLSKPG